MIMIFCNCTVCKHYNKGVFGNCKLDRVEIDSNGDENFGWEPEALCQQFEYQADDQAADHESEEQA